ncbi:pseudouridylate synthase [Dyadobacter tibetensis]|uniref:pseudouridylate synthase n=1 Tax=Dyadobacter tibetensis TaxID=1211851 RepID=UPI0004AF4365|nr:pseudouridylate synthase [Dyadobacter tibetensis]
MPVTVNAVEELQCYLTHQKDWDHNFGLEEQSNAVIGKMFGVLVVQTIEKQWGFLAAFSGKLAGSNQHAYFVPPIYDGLNTEGFLNEGMVQLGLMSQEINSGLVSEDNLAHLKQLRKLHSITLQNKLFDQYHFLNQKGKSKSLRMIFKKDNDKNPPVGAGECAAPKLLQYAFQHHLEPVQLVEFWWGLSPKSKRWKHKHFYAPCQEKCKPILRYMLPENNLISSSTLN